MEIEEMKALWSEMSDQLEQQKKLTNEIIMNMTQERYARKFQTIFNLEAFFSVFSFILSFILLLNFHKLDTWYFLLCGIFTLAIMLLYPIFVLRRLYQLKRLNIIDYSYKETLIKFIKAKNQILKIQRVAAYFYLPLIPAMLLVVVKIMKNENFFAMEKSPFLYVFMGINFLMAAYVARWGYNHYKKITNSAEGILKELE